MTDRITAYLGNTTLTAASDTSLSRTTPQKLITWENAAGPANITGGVPSAYAGRNGFVVELDSTITDPTTGQNLVSWAENELTEGNWDIEARLSLGGVVSGVRWVEYIVTSLYVPPTGEPVVTAPGTVTLSGTGPVTATFAAPTYTGTEPITVTLAATLAGASLSVSGGTATIARTAVAQTVAAVWTITGAVGDPLVTAPVTVTVPAYTVPAAMVASVPVVLSATAIRFPRPAAPFDGGTAITSYRFYHSVNGTPQAVQNDVGAQVDLTGLTAGDVVVGEFRAVNAAGESLPGATATAQTWQLPAQMSALTITGGVSSVTVDATAAANLNGRPLNTNGYRYEFYNSGGTVVLTVNRADTSGFTQTGVPAGSGVYVTVHARTDAGAGPVSPNSNAVTVATGASATLTEFTSAADVMIFDGRGAFMENSGTIPWAATTDADDGAIVEVQWVEYNRPEFLNPDTPTGVVGAWQAGAAVSGGAASGALTGVPRNQYTYYRLQSRVQGSATAPNMMTKKVAVGHVDLWIAQSNGRWVFELTGGTPATLTEPGNIQRWMAARGNPLDVGPSTVISITNGIGQLTTGMAAFANEMAKSHPGEYIAFGNGFVAGIEAKEWIDPDDTARVWDHDMRLIDDMTHNGLTSLGKVVNASWTAFIANNASISIAIMAGRSTVDGSQISTGGTIPGDGTTLHRTLRDKLDFTKTKLMFIGSTGRPHRENDFPILNVADALTKPAQAENIAAGWINALVNRPELFPEFLPYQGNTETFARRRSDFVHWEPASDAGTPRIARYYANVVSRATGRSSFAPARFTNSDWTTTHIDLWNTDYDMSTHATLAGGSSAVIRGFAVNGGFITSGTALLANAGGSGRVGIRITRATDGSDLLEYGRGGMPGATVLADIAANYQDDLPIAIVPGAPSGWMPMEARPTITSNLVSGDPFFVKAVGGSAYTDPNGFGAASGFTIKGEMRVTTHNVITATASQGWRFEVLSDRRLRFSVVDRGPSFDTAGTVFPAGAFVPFVWTFDLTGGTTTVWWGDAETETFALTGSGSTITNTARQIILLGSSLGADVRFVEVWKAATATRDTTGLGTPHKRIEAGAGGTIVQIPDSPVW